MPFNAVLDPDQEFFWCTGAILTRLAAALLDITNYLYQRQLGCDCQSNALMLDPQYQKIYRYQRLRLGMLIPGYLDTRVPCGLPGSGPGSRETSDLPSYRDRLHQSTDCPCGHIHTKLRHTKKQNN